MNPESKKRLFELFAAHAADSLTPEEHASLQETLRQDAEARRLWFVHQDVELGLHAHLSVESLVLPSVSAKPSRWLSWRPLAAAAAGIVFGMFCTAVAFGYVAPRVVEKVRVVFSEGFEKGVSKTAPGLPLETGVWSGDEAEVIASTPEVKAHGGGKMLRFLSATYPGENSPRSQWGDVYRIVDVRGLAAEGRTVARVSARFVQGGAGNGEARFVGRVGAFALDQELSTLPTALSHTWLQQNNSAAGSRRVALVSTGQWQEVAVEVPITRETRFVVLHLAVVQEQPKLTSGIVQFPAHFMDEVKVELITRP